MSRARDERRAAAWLQERGWMLNVNGLWWNRQLAPGRDECTLAEAVRRQTRHDHEAATSARNINIRDADAGMDDDWRRAAMAAIRHVAELMPEFSTDHVLDEDPTLEQGREPRALGPMMLYAAKDGLIAPTDRYVSSSRKASNARAKRAWKSLVYGGHAPQPQVTEHLDVIEAVGP